MRHGATLLAASLLFTLGAVYGCSSSSDQVQQPQGGTIGPVGGQMLGPSGAAVTVPSGALSSETVLAIEISTSGYPALPAGEEQMGSVFAFTPHGQSFGSNVTVKVPFTRGSAGTPELLSAAPGGAWSVVAGAIASGNAMEAKVAHFSFFVVAAASDAGAPAADAGSDAAQAAADGGADVDATAADGDAAGADGDAAQPPDGGALFSGSMDGTWRLVSKICNGTAVDMTGALPTDFVVTGTTGRFVNSMCDIPVTLSYPGAGSVVWVIGQNTCGGVGDTHTATYVVAGGTLTLTEPMTPAGEFGCPSGRQVSTLQKQ